MKPYLLSIVAVSLFLVACGPSAEEKARLQKIREDSIRIAAENATRKRLETKLALTDSINSFEAQVEGLENRLTYVKAELEVATDKMITIKQVQFLRTPAEREQQIRAQAVIIDQLQKETETLPERIQLFKIKIAEFKSRLKQFE